MSQEKPVRAFIAIALPDGVRQRIANFQHAWREALRGNSIRWTPADQIHLTLRFLGNVPTHAGPGLEAALRRACQGVPGFELEAGGSGCFPDARKPRVLWIGVDGDLKTLMQLHARVTDETKTWGEMETREFRAHLTIGRVKDASPPVSRDIAQRAQTMTCGELGRWRVREVVLMRSELSPGGATHFEMARVELAG
jgi:2'-5' RNA ligase